MKILLIDDHKLLSENLKNSLERSKEVELVDICEKADQIKELAVSGKYDIVLMDINLRGISEKDGLVLTKEILAERSGIRIVMLTGFDLKGYELEARRIGASGFFSKEIGTSELIQKLKLVYEGKTMFTRSREYEEPLTEKEKRILELYCGGEGRKEVAEKMHISMRTLANHLNTIYEKMDVSNYQEMVQKALKEGYVRMYFI